MRLSFFIVKRIVQNKHKTFATFIVRLSIVSTALSVCTMIVTLLLVSGFQEEIRHKIFDFWGDIHIQKFELNKSLNAEESMITVNDTIVREIQQIPFVQAIEPYATKSVVAKKKDWIEGLLFKGVSSNLQYRHLNHFLVKGRWPQVDTGIVYSKEIAVSTALSKKLKLSFGDTLDLMFISKDDQTIQQRKAIVVGFFNTGIADYDNLFVMGDMRLVQRLNKWNINEIGGYEIFLTSHDKMNEVNNSILNINNLPVDWLSKTIEETFPSIFDWLLVQNTNRNVILIIMTIVSVVNMMTCLLILVLERSRMIGILQAIGMAQSHIQRIFVHYVVLLSAIGTVIGALVGIGIGYIEYKTHFIHLNENSYLINYVPVSFHWGEIIIVIVGSIVVSYICLLFPVRMIRKVKPIKIIQLK